jgi:DNA-binding MarR family transcriptional regulator
MRYLTFIVASSRTIDHDRRVPSIPNAPQFTEKQGQYLAFIYTYELLNRRAPAEADIRAFFGVTPPTVHSMILELERKGLISRRPREARSITVCIPEDDIPRLRRQPIVSSVSRY